MTMVNIVQAHLHYILYYQLGASGDRSRGSDQSG